MTKSAHQVTSCDHATPRRDGKKQRVFAGFHRRNCVSRRKTGGKRLGRNCLILRVPPDAIEKVVEFSGVGDGFSEVRLDARHFFCNLVKTQQNQQHRDTTCRD
jgi:hypothetical protein